MKKKIVSYVIGMFFIVGVAGSADAALHSRAGGTMIYDDDFDITWIRDANHGAGSMYDDGVSATDGLMTWASANLWAANLIYGGLGGWRLPTAVNRNGTGPCAGFVCPESEMGHLYRNELGGTVGGSILNSGDPDLLLFTNIQSSTSSSSYWLSTPYFMPNQGHSWYFQMYGGFQYFVDENNEYAAWAVRSGDVPIPEPGTYLLLVIGLAAMALYRKKGVHCS